MNTTVWCEYTTIIIYNIGRIQPIENTEFLKVENTAMFYNNCLQ